jgi:Xaa-Pro aminopeptidase
MTPESFAGEWELPFTAAEYDGRLRRVRLEMERRGVDLLYVTSPPNLTYLLGHESVWFDARNVGGLAIPLSAGGPVFFDSWRNESGWPPTIGDAVLIDEGVPAYYPHGLGVVTSALRERGLLQGSMRVALEYWSWAPGGPALAALARRFREAGADVVNGSWIVDHVRLVKSPQEIAYMRTALEIADQALGRARDALRPGVTEKQLAGIMYDEILGLGGDEPGVRIMVRSGPNSNRFRRPATRRAVQKGELVMIDMSAAFNHYHGATARAFSLGPDPFWSDALARANEALWAVVAAVEPGESTRRLQELTDRAVDDAGLRRHVWWVGGHALGTSLPPDSVGHVYLSEREGFEAGYLVSGFATTWQIQLEDRDAHVGGGIVDTLIVGDDAIVAPAVFPRTLTIV